MTDLVDCMRLAAGSVVLERVYELSDLPRLRDRLAEPVGSVRASFAFSLLGAGRAGAEVRIAARPVLECQRCLRGFGCNLRGGSEIEFADDEESARTDTEREFVRSSAGMVSLRDLAEEELLLALPLAPACDIPRTCGNAPDDLRDGQTSDAPGETRRPFGGLKDLLKKT